MIETACGDSLQWSFVRSEAVQYQALLADDDYALLAGALMQSSGLE